LVVIEGLDGVGKTSTGRALCRVLRKLDFPVMYRHWETTYLPRAYKYFRNTRDVGARFFFQMSALALLNREMGSVPQGTVCISDRYSYSAVCYYAVVTNHTQLVAPLVSLLPTPELPVLLECNADTRRRRLLWKGHAVSARKLETVGPLGERILNLLRPQAEWFTVDNTALSVTDCVNVIVEEIRARYKPVYR